MIADITMGYGVMVTLQILVLSFLVRVRVSQQRAFFTSKNAFFLLLTQARFRAETCMDVWVSGVVKA